MEMVYYWEMEVVSSKWWKVGRQMIVDFTVAIYSDLLIRLEQHGYCFQRIEDYIRSPKDKAIMLRHDVDLRNYAALRLARD
jgi:hypothetical protein